MNTFEFRLRVGGEVLVDVHCRVIHEPIIGRIQLHLFPIGLISQSCFVDGVGMILTLRVDRWDIRAENSRVSPRLPAPQTARPGRVGLDKNGTVGVCSFTIVMRIAFYHLKRNSQDLSKFDL